MRRKSVRTVLASIGRLRGTVKIERGRLCRRLAGRPTAPAGASPAYELVLAHLDAELAVLEPYITDAENLYLYAQQALAAARRRRDRETAAVEELLRPIQRVLSAETRPCAGLSCARTGAYALAEEAAMTLHSLMSLESDPPPVLGVKLDPAIAGAELRAANERLETALAEFVAASSEAVFSRNQADEAVARGNELVPHVQQVIDGFKGLAQPRKELLVLDT